MFLPNDLMKILYDLIFIISVTAEINRIKFPVSNALAEMHLFPPRDQTISPLFHSP